MSRIYKVTTPTGNRLVDANTKAQAIGHCVATDYQAEPISSSELYAAIEAGAKVEKVEPAPAKKSSSASPSTTPSSTAPSSAPAAAAPNAVTDHALPNSSIVGSAISNPPHSQPLVNASAPANNSTQASNASSPQPTPAPTPASIVAPAPSGQSGAASAGWTAPASANPILAEQARINPQAVAAAGLAPANPAPIIPVSRPTPPAAPAQPDDANAGWTTRATN